MKFLLTVFALSLSFSSFAIEEEILHVCKTKKEVFTLKKDCTDMFLEKKDEIVYVKDYFVQPGIDLGKNYELAQAAHDLDINLHIVTSADILKLHDGNTFYRFHLGFNIRPVAGLKVNNRKGKFKIISCD